MGHNSHDPCFLKKHMELGVMTLWPAVPLTVVRKTYEIGGPDSWDDTTV